MEMWHRYISSTIENMPGAYEKMTFDRFLMQHVNDAVDSLRKEENRELVKRWIMDINVQST